MKKSYLTKNTAIKFLKNISILLILIFNIPPAFSSQDAGDISVKVVLFENIPLDNSTPKPVCTKPDPNIFPVLKIGENGSPLAKIADELQQKKDQNRQNVFLKMLEKRYFGEYFENETIENRLTKLELHVFGKKQEGSTSFRYEDLIKKIPAYNNI